MFSDLWKDGIQVANDFIRELICKLENISGADMVVVQRKGVKAGCHGPMFGSLVQRFRSNLFPCAKRLDEPVKLVFSYFGGFFPMYFHHVVQAVSPAIGTNDVRSCGEMDTLALIPIKT